MLLKALLGLEAILDDDYGSLGKKPMQQGGEEGLS